MPGKVSGNMQLIQIFIYLAANVKNSLDTDFHRYTQIFLDRIDRIDRIKEEKQNKNPVHPVNPV